MCADETAVLQDRGAIAQRKDFVETVRDEEHGDAAFAQPAQALEQQRDLAPGDDSGGLVEDQQPDIVRHGARDLDHLLVGDRERSHRRARIEGDAELAHQLGCLLPGAPVVDQAESVAPLVAEEDVLGDGQLRKQRELLVDHVDAGEFCLARRRPAHGLTGEDHLALVGRKRAGDDLDQGGLAGAVLAEQAVDLASAGRRGSRR